MRLPTKYLCLSLVPIVVGCAADAPEGPRTGGATGTAMMSMSQAGRYVDEPRDPAPARSIVFQVDVFRIAVPFGTFSSNEEFWKRINEQCVDVATYDLLYKNGIRVGEAPLSELQSFRRYMSDIVPAQKLTVTGMEVRNVEVPMKKDLPEQTIFHYDHANQLAGNSFGRSENLFTVAFEPTPRRPGYLRLTLCPVVRSQRKILQYTPSNEPREFAFINPERMYQLNMRVDIPRDSFLVVTASSEAEQSVSVGRAFMTLDGPAERMEQVLLILPKPYVAPPPQPMD